MLALLFQTHDSKCFISGLLYNTKHEEGILIEKNECDLKIDLHNINI